MRAAVAGVCALLSPLLLTATLQAQEPERVIRRLDFQGNTSITDEVLRAGISTTNSSFFATSALVSWLQQQQAAPRLTPFAPESRGR